MTKIKITTFDKHSNLKEVEYEPITGVRYEELKKRSALKEDETILAFNAKYTLK